MPRLAIRDSRGILRPLRIAILIDRFDGMGGAEAYTRDLAGWLADRGCDVHVIARTSDASTRRLPFTVHQVAASRSWSAFRRSVADRMAAIAPDVTHDMGVAVGCDIFHSHVGSPVACQRGANRAHPAWYRPVRSLVQSAGRRRRIAARAAAQFRAAESLFIALSRRGAADLMALHGVASDRIRLVPNGVDTERFAARRLDAGAMLRKRCGFAADDVVVIGVAHNPRLKGIPVLTRTVRRLRREGLPLKLLLCGGETGRDPAVGDAVVDLGNVTDMAACYAAADIAVQWSFYDACSLATLESLASGLPVVTTRANGASELLTSDVDAIVLDDAADVTKLAATLRRLGSDRWLRAALGRAGRHRATELDSTRAFSAMVAVYGEVVADRGGRLEAPETSAAVRRAG